MMSIFIRKPTDALDDTEDTLNNGTSVLRSPSASGDLHNEVTVLPALNFLEFIVYGNNFEPL